MSRARLKSLALLGRIVRFLFHQPDYGAAMRRILDERGPRIEELYTRHCRRDDS